MVSITRFSKAKGLDINAACGQLKEGTQNDTFRHRRVDFYRGRGGDRTCRDNRGAKKRKEINFNFAKSMFLVKL